MRGTAQRHVAHLRVPFLCTLGIFLCPSPSLIGGERLMPGSGFWLYRGVSGAAWGRAPYHPQLWLPISSKHSSHRYHTSKQSRRQLEPPQHLQGVQTDPQWGISHLHSPPPAQRAHPVRGHTAFCLQMPPSQCPNNATATSSPCRALRQSHHTFLPPLAAYQHLFMPKHSKFYSFPKGKSLSPSNAAQAGIKS